MIISTIVLGSTSPCKTEALKKALLPLQSPTLHLLTRNIDTGLPPQPIGLAQTMLGAYRRAFLSFRLDPVAMSRHTLYIGIESGLVLLPGTQAYGERHSFALDLAVIYLLHGESQLASFCTSVGVMIPYSLTQDVILEGGRRTIGQLMAEDSELDPRDPHIELCGISRVNLLADALYIQLLQTELGANAPEKRTS